MNRSTVIAYLDDGPRAGEAMPVHTGPDGAPPDEVMVSDPRAMDEPAEETVEVGFTLKGSTTYHVDQPASAADTYIYRVAGTS